MNKISMRYKVFHIIEHEMLLNPFYEAKRNLISKPNKENK